MEENAIEEINKKLKNTNHSFFDRMAQERSEKGGRQKINDRYQTA